MHSNSRFLEFMFPIVSTLCRRDFLLAQSANFEFSTLHTKPKQLQVEIIYDILFLLAELLLCYATGNILGV